MMTQKQLCEKLPGVYYYTVCRQYLIPEEEQASGWAFWTYTPNVQKSVNPRIQSVISLPPHMQRVARSNIGEAETKRKYTVKKMYNNRAAAEAKAKEKANPNENVEEKKNQSQGGNRQNRRKTAKKRKNHQWAVSNDQMVNVSIEYLVGRNKPLFPSSDPNAWQFYEYEDEDEDEEEEDEEGSYVEPSQK